MNDFNQPDQPIVVNGTALPSTLAAALRYAVVLLLGACVERGYLPQESAEGIVAFIIMGATIAYGLWKTHKHKADLIVAASAAPNDVAIVKK